MIERVDQVAFGRPASVALAATIHRAQQHQPLAPVTVVVPSNLAGLAARRTLAAGLDGQGRGLVNVAFVTAVRLAQLLAADVASPRRPLTNPVLASAVRRALADDPRPFGEVAGHVATETAVAATYAELSRLSPGALRAVGDHPRGVVAGGLHRRVARLLVDYDDEDAVVRALLERPDVANLAQRLGHLVWHLPERLSSAQTQLVAALARVVPTSVIVGLTGEPAADRLSREVCGRVDVRLADDGAPSPPTADRIVSVSDAEQEAREVVRAIHGLLAAGVAAERIGVFYPVADPYLRILAQQFGAAGLPASGPRPDRLLDAPVARALRSALALDSGWRRDRVMELVASVPVRLHGAWVRTTEWDRISRRAGVVGGLGDWRRKLAGFIADAEAQVAAGSARQGRALAEAAGATALLAFVDQLAEGVGAMSSATTWALKAAASEALLTSLVGRSSAQLNWPAEQRDALDRVFDALNRLSTLDPIEPRPSAAVFRRALDAELDVSSGRTSPYGTGILYGPLVTAIGQDLDAVFVVGMIEGLCPTSRRDEALLPEAARLAAGGELPTPDEEMAAQHRALLAALAAAPVGRRTLTLPRGDLRSSRQPLPSRWLLHSATALAGRAVYSTDFPTLRIPQVHVVASYAAGWSTDPTTPSLVERDLAAVAAHVASGGDAARHPAASAVRRAIELQRARRSSSFTEFDGNLGGLSVPSPADEQAPLSATRLETWATCGFRYFLQHVLHVAVLDDPERLVTVNPLDRGTALHAVLARFIDEAITEGPPEPHEPWSDARRRRLHELADECFDDIAARGRSGRPLLWSVQRRGLHRVLDRFLDIDDQRRAATGAVPRAVEYAFGSLESTPVTVRLDERRALRFRGYADRVDATSTGLAVYDYKTGRSKPYAGLASDAVVAGTKLQLGIYAEAAGQQLGDRSAVESHYWLLEAEGDPFAGYRWDVDRRDRFVDVLTAIVDGIEAGVYDPQPGELSSWTGGHDNCRFCDFDIVCPAARGEHAEAHAGDPALAVRARLLPPEPSDA